MKKKAPCSKLVEPIITTYENTELTVDTAFTKNSQPPSSRRLKTDLARVDARRTLRYLLSR